MSKAVLIRVRGQVQGVGFRPFIWQLSHRMGVRGEVLNDPHGVLIRALLDDPTMFVQAIQNEAPPLARIDAVEINDFEFPVEPSEFVIAASKGQGAETRVTPDAATCSDCLREISDPSDRRCGYPFANCTHCGPRLTIVQSLPYDRGRTTMASFEMCADCAAEYADPSDRRFHAQPIACPACGPRIWLEPAGIGDPINEAAEMLRSGKILAIKGIGGFHLAVDATNVDAIALLRARKQRPTKPLALMARIETTRRYAAVSTAEKALLCDAAAPIVLLSKSGAPLPENLAPGQTTLGWMQPYSPLHHLLLDVLDRPLVMTSGNLSGEPQVIGNDEARETLGHIVDAFVMHNRDIARRLDDSVERVTDAGPMVLRRARGRVPGTLPLPDGFADAPQIAAYGGQMKAAICLIKNGQAMLGHHLGELDEVKTWDAFLQADQDYADLFDHRPESVACDLHPDFRASRHAVAKGLPVERVQHHHAHLASCLGENGWPLDGGKVAGIILDGLGLGLDGTVWGGELLLGDYRDFERRGWLRPASLIGGDAASREPWRNALARLDQAGLSDWADELFGLKPLDTVRMAAHRQLNAPLSSSAGRLFDAVAALLGLCADRQSFEGEAAMQLEALAARGSDHPGHEMALVGEIFEPAEIFRQIRSELNSGAASEEIALGFHRGLARSFAGAARGLFEQGKAKAVVLSGGCFQNALLLEETIGQLGDIPILVHQKTPANDGGLALGQGLVAAAKAVSN